MNIGIRLEYVIGQMIGYIIAFIGNEYKPSKAGEC